MLLLLLLHTTICSFHTRTDTPAHFCVLCCENICLLASFLHPWLNTSPLRQPFFYSLVRMQNRDTQAGRPAPVDMDGSLNDGVFQFFLLMYCEMLFHTPCASDLLVSALVDSEDLTPIIKAVYRSGSPLPLIIFDCSFTLCHSGVVSRRSLS